VRNEARILAGLSRTVLPQVGASVQKLVLANCRTLTNGMVRLPNYAIGFVILCTGDLFVIYWRVYQSILFDQEEFHKII
jgi:hypothetical protein